MIDSLLAATANRTRRRLLERLESLDPDDTLSVDDFLDDAASADRVRLRHVHLPKLEDSDLVRWDRDGGSVERGRGFDRVRPLLRAVREVERDDGRGATPSESASTGR